MKKLLFLLLAVAIAMNCFVSCNVSPAENTSGLAIPGGDHASGSDPSDEQPAGTNAFIIPEDETSAVHTATVENTDGLRMEITVHGYQSESLNKTFYVKNNEYFLVDVKVTNTSDAARWQWLPTYCRTSDPAHNHEIGFELANGEYKLSSSSFGFACGALIDVWKLEPGATYEWQLKLAAGEVKSGGDYDLSGDGDGYRTGIDLYENDIYKDGVCTFAGEFSFGYKTSDAEHFNDFSISVPLSVDVVYISAEPSK